MDLNCLINLFLAQQVEHTAADQINKKVIEAKLFEALQSSSL